tara:strand:- start:6140 stop:6550 length:411 start_codon:yes stop_codon:yes gene_type:complete
MKTIILNSDHVGILSSCLCLTHCILTPLFFLYQIETYSLSNAANFFWYTLNYFFLIISFFAVGMSIKNSSKKSIKILMLMSWFFLFGLILNEQLELLKVPEFFSYSAAISLCSLHIYNMNFCRCKDESCCANSVKK